MSRTKPTTLAQPPPSILRITGWFYRDEFDRMPRGVKNGTATSMQLMKLQVSDRYPLIVACPIRNTRKFTFKAYDKYWR